MAKVWCSDAFVWLDGFFFSDCPSSLCKDVYGVFVGVRRWYGLCGVALLSVFSVSFRLIIRGIKGHGCFESLLDVSTLLLLISER